MISGAGTTTCPGLEGLMRYIVTRYYKCKHTEYQEGQVIEIDDPEYAAWLARDMRGYLEPILPEPPPEPEPEPEPEPARAIEAPPHDRMVRKSRTKRRRTTKPVAK